MTEKFVPSEKSWLYFTQHLSDIRSIVEDLLPVRKMQSMVGPFGSETKFSMEDFDKAVVEQDSLMLTRIMNDAWLRAPEDRAIYQVPGFTEMCNLLDCTVDGFFPDSGPEDDKA